MGMQTQKERETGRRAAQREQWRINRAQVNADKRGWRGRAAEAQDGVAWCYWPPLLQAWGAGAEGGRGQKRRAPACWRPEERRVAQRRRMRVHMERARAAAGAMVADERGNAVEVGDDAGDDVAERERDVDGDGGEAPAARIDDG